LLAPRTFIGRRGGVNHIYACAISLQRCSRWRCSGLSNHCRRNAGLVAVGLAALEHSSSARQNSDDQVPTRNGPPDQSPNARRCCFRREIRLKRQAKPASSTMSRNIDQEIADMRQELKDLEAAIARQDPPLAPHTRSIAEAKIAALQRQIAAITGGNGHQPALSE
jgi:hypothetical protein